VVVRGTETNKNVFEVCEDKGDSERGKYYVTVYVFLNFTLLVFPAHTKLYGCQVRRRHHLERKDGGGFDPNEYEKFPSRYISTFSKKVGHNYIA
jgi:hypothetical protein